MSVSKKQEQTGSPGSITALAHNHVPPRPSLLQHLPQRRQRMQSPQNIDRGHYCYAHIDFILLYDAAHVCVQYSCMHTHTRLRLCICTCSVAMGLLNSALISLLQTDV